MTSLFFATTPAPSAAGGLTGTFMWVAIFIAIFYFTILRPNNKRKAEAMDMHSSLKVGDEVITIGGFYGYIAETDPESAEIKLELADGVVVRLAKSAIQRRILPPLPDDWEPEDVPELQGNFEDDDTEKTDGDTDDEPVVGKDADEKQ